MPGVWGVEPGVDSGIDPAVDAGAQVRIPSLQRVAPGAGEQRAVLLRCPGTPGRAQRFGPVSEEVLLPGDHQQGCAAGSEALLQRDVSLLPHGPPGLQLSLRPAQSLVVPVRCLRGTVLVGIPGELVELFVVKRGRVLGVKACWCHQPKRSRYSARIAWS